VRSSSRPGCGGDGGLVPVAVVGVPGGGPEGGRTGELVGGVEGLGGGATEGGGVPGRVVGVGAGVDAAELIAGGIAVGFVALGEPGPVGDRGQPPRGVVGLG
jgi:hypothetical protein